MNKNRDNFTQKTIQLLGKRVNYVCSNPDCRRGTIAASTGNESYINTGVASHICAAAPRGPRYDFKTTPEERKSIDNGIWLCQTCSKLIDSDETNYSIKKLNEWKLAAENRALEGLVKPIYEITENDKKIINIIPMDSALLDDNQFEDENIYSDLYTDYIKKFDNLKDYLYSACFGNFFNKDYNSFNDGVTLNFGKEILNWLIGKEKFPIESLTKFYEKLSIERGFNDNSLLKNRWKAVNLYFCGEIEQSQNIYFELYDIINKKNNIPDWFKDDIYIDGRNIINLIDNINGKYSYNNIFQEQIDKNKHKLSYPGIDRIRCDVYERSIEKVIDYKNKCPNTVMYGIGIENILNHIQEAVYLSILYGSITQLRLVRRIFSNVMALYSDSFEEKELYELTLKIKILAGEFDDFKKIYNKIKYKYDFVNNKKFINDILELKKSLLSFDLNNYNCCIFEVYGRDLDDTNFDIIENEIYKIIDDKKQINPYYIEKALKSIPNNMLRLKNKTVLFEILLNYVRKRYSRYYIYFGNILNNIKLEDLNKNEKTVFMSLINNCYKLENVNVLNAVLEIKNTTKTNKYDLYLYQSNGYNKIVSYINEDNNIEALKQIITEIQIRVDRREDNPSEHIGYASNYDISNFFSIENYNSSLKQIVINDIIPLSEKILKSNNQYASEKIKILKTIFNILSIDSSIEILSRFKTIIDNINLKYAEEHFGTKKNKNDIEINILLLKCIIGKLKFKDLIFKYLILIGESDNNLVEIFECLQQIVTAKKITRTDINHIYIIYNYAINKRNILFTRYAIKLAYVFVKTKFSPVIKSDFKQIINYNNYDEIYCVAEMIYHLDFYDREYFKDIISIMSKSTNYNIKYVVNKYCKISK